ncbi:MAG: 30S ribosome-binding factor RbfA [Chloroflexi bacterium]|nr:30S ribosome-binding factor RbfA [Chloroflexota bacterium]
MVPPSRAARIGRQMQEALSELLLFEVTDPRLEGVYVTDVTVDRELAYASIYVSALEGVVREAEILDGFKSASGFLRSQLAKRVQLRSFPQLRFHWDPTPEHADKIDRLLASLHDDDSSDSPETQEDSE